MIELCERLDGLVQLDSEFHELNGNRNVITFITDSEKDPKVLGFSLMDEQPAALAIEADMEDDADVPGADIPVRFLKDTLW